MLAERPYDVIQCHFGRNGLHAMMLRQMGIVSGKLAVAFHGYDVSRFIEENGESVYDELFQRAEILMPVSEHWRKRLVNQECSRSFDCLPSE